MKKATSGSQYRTRGKTHYEHNKLKYIQGVLDRRDRNMQYIWEIKKSGKCAHCGEQNPIVLDFDHLSGKDRSISNAAWSCWSIARLDKEIAKCQILCANCHRIKTFKEGNRGEKYK